MDSAPLLIPTGDWKEVTGSVVAPKGFRATGMYAGMRSGAKGDLSLVVCDDGAVAAGTFTQNVMCAAPVTVCKDVLARNNTGVKAVRSKLLLSRSHLPAGA
jgi:glutamate N-acetyltransferase / amino-acid N-acetyltransferase